MSIPKSWWSWGALGIAAAALSPVAAQWIRGPREDTCALDGMATSPRVRVRMLDAAGGELLFCSLTCAELWLNASGVFPRAIYVKDEVSGEELPASRAYYVRSRITAHASTRERRHVFRDRAAAQAHARAFGGRILTRVERPFDVFLQGKQEGGPIR